MNLKTFNKNEEPLAYNCVLSFGLCFFYLQRFLDFCTVLSITCFKNRKIVKKMFVIFASLATLTRFCTAEFFFECKCFSTLTPKCGVVIPT